MNIDQDELRNALHQAAAAIAKAVRPAMLAFVKFGRIISQNAFPNRKAWRAFRSDRFAAWRYYVLQHQARVKRAEQLEDELWSVPSDE